MNTTSNVVTFRAPWRSLLQKGLSAMRDGQKERAIHLFEQALTLAPNEADVQFALGRMRIRENRYPEAEKLLGSAYEQKRESSLIASTLARVIGFHQGRHEDAFKLIHHALKHVHDPAPLHVIRGELLLEQGSFQAAREAFSSVLDIDHTSKAARIGLARTYNLEGLAFAHEGQLERSIFAFKHASNLDSSWASPYINLGVVLSSLGKHRRAEEAYLQALTQDPNNPVAHFNLGNVYHLQGKRQKALAELTLLREQFPDYPNANTTLASLYGELGQFDRAIAIFLEEAEREPGNAKVWSGLGLAYVCSGNLDRGEECLLHAITLDEEHFNAFCHLATLYSSQGRTLDAKKMATAAVRLNREKAYEILNKHFTWPITSETPLVLEHTGDGSEVIEVL